MPPTNYFTPGVPRAREDQVAHGTDGAGSTDPHYGPYALSFQTNASAGCSDMYQPIPSASTLAAHVYPIAQSESGVKEQSRPNALLSSATATPILVQQPTPINDTRVVFPMAKHAGSPVASGFDGSETLHLRSKSSASIAAGFRPETPTKVISDQNQETVHAGQKRPISDVDAETSRIKKARNDSIEKAMQHYKDNKPAIDYWWMSQQKSPRAPWFERFTSWKANGSLVPEPRDANNQVNQFEAAD
ncbi:uncharacterized protein ALTATR162_LOCUS9331 [Alternaria atra]|uniref:Uncharacterized protein n=1 Tax=Alternaria atra TaxID=119953 RepID=A0A8J2N351_9PLEO|nr:uncharacterized protein ALTATR162_LOCUS9331 [Alternaria atra]CAG5179528.1 unnamed protein product [Alternaria atra]